MFAVGAEFEKGITQALFDAQGEFPDLIKDSVNPHFKSSYISLEGVFDSVMPVLRKHGVLVMQAPSAIGEVAALTTSFIHVESGTSISSTTPLWSAQVNAHGQGAAITYMRRYAVCAMLGLVPEADDDGNKASKPSRTKAAPSEGSGRAKKTQPADDADDVGF